MKKKWLIIVDVLVLVLVVLISLGMIWNFSFKETASLPEECIDVNMVSSFVYDACYDAYLKKIFLEARRGVDNYKINALKISFFDFSEQVYELTDVPDVKGAKAYKISAEKNPQNIDVRLNILKDFSAPICDESRKLFVRYCPVGISEEGVSVNISPLKDVNAVDFIEIGKAQRQDSDSFSLSLIDKERIWKSKCESRWECEGWGPCVDGVQRRECRDAKKCFIPTGVPMTVQYCGESCYENWECEWSKCSTGFTTPKCKDLNKCGTSYNVPQKLRCESDTKCSSNVECGEWSSCEIDYNFDNLMGESIGSLIGTKSRICEDKNDCLDLQKETRSCSVNMDIYTRSFVKCGESFVGIYNRLNNDLIARIKSGTDENPYLDIYIDREESDQYCDYCFDGEMNGDEEGVDCGGSCEECSDKYKRVFFEEKSWWDNFMDWVKGIL